MLGLSHGRPTRAAARTSWTLAAAVVMVIAGVTAVYAEPEPELSEVRETVDELHDKAAEANERYNLAVDERAALERRVDSAAAAVERQEARVAEVSSELGGFAAASYRSGVVDLGLRALLTDDPSDFLATAALTDAFAVQQAGRLAAVAEERRELEQQRLIAAEELARLEAVEATLAAEKEAVDELLSEQQRLLDRLTAEQQARLMAERQRAHEEAKAERAAAAEQISRSDTGAAVGDRAVVAVQAALSKVGSPYVYGGKGPGSFDCSGFTSWAWAQAGVSLSPASGAQATQGRHVPTGQLQPGDLLFYDSPISHVAMYIGDGRVVHAANPRTGVTTAPAMDAGGPAKPFVTATRPG